MNRYTYAHNDPVQYVDPTGLYCVSADGRYSHPGACSSPTSTYIPDEVYYNRNKSQDKVTNKSTSSYSSGSSSGSSSGTSSPSNNSQSDSPKDLERKRDDGDSKQDLTFFDRNGNGIADWLEEETADEWVYSGSGWDHVSTLEGGVHGPTAEEIRVITTVRSILAPSSKGTNVGLREFAESRGGKVKWDQQTGTATITINGTTRRFEIADYEVRDGHIQADSGQLERAFDARVTFFQHGLSDTRRVFSKMTQSFGNEEYVIDLGVISARDGVEINTDNGKVRRLFRDLGLKASDDKTHITDKLLAHGYNVLYRTEFSNSTGGHYEQINELADYIDAVTHTDEKVNLVGHSKGGLVSIGYAAYMYNRVDKVVTVSTPYKPNLLARSAVEAVDAAYKTYEIHTADYIAKGPGLLNWREKKRDAAKAAFDKAMDVGTQGVHRDYNKIEGIRDLAGETSALEQLRNEWNTQRLNGNLNSVRAYAIATDSYDMKRYNPYSSMNGDMVVSTQSQRAPGFYGIIPITHTVTGRDRNTDPYSHVYNAEQEPIIDLVSGYLGF